MKTTIKNCRSALSLVYLLAISQIAHAQWGRTAPNVYLTTSTDKVGIGTTTPETKLHINDQTSVSSFTGINNAGLRIHSFDNPLNNYALIGFSGFSSAFTRNLAQIGANFTNSGSFLSFGTSNNYATGITNTAMTIDYNGYVGIGTTTPAAKLDVAGNIKIADGSQGAGKVLTSDNNGLASWATPAVSAGWGLSGNSIASGNFIGTTNALPLVIKTAVTQPINFLTNNSQAMTILSGGNVGIGTTSPETKLHINDQTAVSSFTGINNAGLRIHSSDNALNNYALIGFSGYSSAFTRNLAQLGANFNSSGSSLFFGTSNNYASGITNTAMTINYNGSVGIGTTSPAAKLDVAGNLKIADGSQGTGKVLTSDKNGLASWAAPTVGTGWGLSGNSITSGNFIGTTNALPLVIKTTVAQPINFLTNNIQSMTILSDGNVGIGTTTPFYPLHVTGNTAYTGYFTNFADSSMDNSGVYGECSRTPGYGIGVLGQGGFMGVGGEAELAGRGNRIGVNGYGANGTDINMGIEGSAVGGSLAYGVYGLASGATTNYAGYFAGDVYTTGSYLPSDRKLKTAIQPVGNAMAVINNLKPSVYTYKTDEYKQMHLPEGLHYGLIADEVQQVVPGMVKKAVQPAEYENHDLMKGKKLSDEVEFNAVNYTEMIPILIGAVKEQQAMIEKLSAQVAALQGSNMNNGTATISVNAASDVPLLGQNIPNPAANNTIIPFRIPKNCNSASIVISEVGSGRIVTAIPVSCSETHLAIDAGSLARGSYTYSLYINGKLVDSKQMILTK